MGAIVRGKIQRGDIALWDGATKTVSRVDATGGTVTGLTVGDSVDVLQVFGSGTSRTRGTIATATGTIGSTNTALLFSTGTWTIDDDLTIPSNFTCLVSAGCVFDVASGKTLTLAGPVSLENSTWSSGSGTVVITGDWPSTDVGQTAAELAASVTPTDYTYPPGNILRYGADTAAANNAPAIQAAVNQCSHSGAKVVVPKGRWNHTTTIYYYYDGSNNPGFATDQVPEGDVLCEGCGPTDYGFEFNSTPDAKANKGSVLYYTGSGNAHSLDGSEVIHCVKHRDLSLVGTTIGVIYRADDCSRFVGLENVFVGNHDTGDGQCIHWSNSYYVKISDCWVVSKSSTSEASVFENVTGGGGVWRLQGTTFRGGATACRVGVETGGAAMMQNPHISSCQFHYADNGLIVGTGCKGGVISGNYFEHNNDRSLWIYNGAKQIDVVGNWFGNKADMTANIELGLRTSEGADIVTENSFSGISIRNNIGDSENYPFLRRTAHTAGRCQTTIDSNDFGGDEGNTVSVDNSGAEGLIFTNNRLGGRADTTLTDVIANAALFISGGENTEGQVVINGVWQEKVVGYDTSDDGEDVDSAYSFVKLDSNPDGGGGAFTVEVQDGLFEGQRVVFCATSTSGEISVDFNADSTPDDSIGGTGRKLDTADEWFEAVWVGSKWRLLGESGSVAYP